MRNGSGTPANLCSCPLQKPVAEQNVSAMGFCKEAAVLLGYARVSTEDQDTTAQVNALTAAGAERIFTERASGGRWDRPELHRVLDQARPGDVVLGWKLDRLSRSLKDLLHIIERLDAAGAGFRSMTEAIDTTVPAGRMMMQMLGAFAEFERAMVRERTRAGLAAAAAQGRHGGRRPKLAAAQRNEVVDMVSTGRRTGAEAARLFGVNPATISRVLATARHETVKAAWQAYSKRCSASSSSPLPAPPGVSDDSHVRCFLMNDIWSGISNI
jgi:DNA invertase Pin-like site-specific DNA recombinase